ncbi:MAG: hypothetical protein EZS28_025148 [Streblomastix strix]|uniref:Uncharacterized protein n=1 Tax=Streblomastix strix TaxID=222440 RepID=A0A5J4V9X5_9EUKA|nr:MAG: hypothetical protein EZS28_025148 [Streblomastix strix]
MRNVITTFGAATGSVNAITDISIDGNTLTPAKNVTFVTTRFDQSITGLKNFTSTIISNGIQYFRYDNSFVFPTGGGDRSIANIQSASYTKSEDDDLLLLKADKTELIDSYTKTVTNNLSNNKANNGVSYTKGEDDTLLFAKADKTQLIDSYSKTETYARDEVFTKTETNNLLNNKTDTAVSYTKDEEDALLLLKADKTELIDSYSKSETYVRDEVYTKSEDDALLLLKTDKTQLIDSYSKTETYARDEVFTKTETKNLLNNKTDTEVSYTKDEDDALLLLKANKTELIDSYSKSETYVRDEVQTKSEDDALLQLKTDKTELIDSYSNSETNVRDEVFTKTETNNLLNNKTNNRVSYTKGEDDTLLFAKADKTQLIDSYSKSETYTRDEVFTKTETNNLLNNKADTGVSYTKDDDDALLLLKADKDLID